MQDWVWVIQLVSALGVATAAVFAWRSSKVAQESAKAANKSAEATENTVKAQIVIQITSTYSSPEMFESVKRLHDFKRKWEPEFGKIFQQLLENKKHDPKYTAQVDADRRRVSHYFHQISAMLDCGVIDEDFVKKLVKPDQVDTLLEVVEPLEAAKNLDYDHSTFDTFRRIYRKES